MSRWTRASVIAAICFMVGYGSWTTVGTWLADARLIPPEIGGFFPARQVFALGMGLGGGAISLGLGWLVETVKRRR
jgi:lipopolysaccharide export LptBFGC system permease protein LptF